MDFRDVVRSGLEEYLGDLEKALDGLSPVELAWRPAPSSNNISWLAWHMARVEDRWVNAYLKQSTEVWIEDGWHERFGMSAEDHGGRQTAEQAVSTPALPMDGLLDYYKAVRAATLEHLDTLSEADLGKRYRHRDRDPGPTVSWVLAHLLIEEAQHLGQAAYIRGMLRGLGR